MIERTYRGTLDGDRIIVQTGQWTIRRGDRELVQLDREFGEIQSAHPDTLTRTL